MKEFVKRLKTSISAEELIQVESWWDKLSEENKEELKSLNNEKSPNQKQIVSIYLCGKYVEQERIIPNNVFWINYFYDYIVNHELVIDEYKVHFGGVCSSNEVAQKSIKEGLIRKNFRCPNSDKNCLMRSILRDEINKSLQLYLKFKLED